MSGVFDAVMGQLAAGSSPRTAARTLGISLDLADAVAGEAARLGLVVTGGTACGTCVPASSPACAGCPLTGARAPSTGGPTPVALLSRAPSRAQSR